MHLCLAKQEGTWPSSPGVVSSCHLPDEVVQHKAFNVAGTHRQVRFQGRTAGIHKPRDFFGDGVGSWRCLKEQFVFILICQHGARSLKGPALESQGRANIPFSWMLGIYVKG